MVWLVSLASPTEGFQIGALRFIPLLSSHAVLRTHTP